MSGGHELGEFHDVNIDFATVKLVRTQIEMQEGDQLRSDLSSLIRGLT